MGYATAGMFAMVIIIFSIVWYVGELCSVLGIVFGCISSSNSKKYVNTRGLGNFKSVKNYHTAATVFMVISCVIIAMWLVFWIWLGIISDGFNYGNNYLSNSSDDWLTDFFASSITMLAVHIGSVIAGIVAQVKYKGAKELHWDILSGKVVPPPPPVVPMAVYPANPYQPNGYYQNGYNGQPNNTYQQNNGYYNRQNPYGQYNNQQYPQQNTFTSNQQNYQQPPQNIADSNQGYVQPAQSSTLTNWQTGTNSQFPDPTMNPIVVQSEQIGITSDNLQNSGASSEKTVVCPNCGEANTDSGKFCTHCGQILK